MYAIWSLWFRWESFLIAMTLIKHAFEFDRLPKERADFAAFIEQAKQWQKAHDARRESMKQLIDRCTTKP